MTKEINFIILNAKFIMFYLYELLYLLYKNKLLFSYKKKKMIKNL